MTIWMKLAAVAGLAVAAAGCGGGDAEASGGAEEAASAVTAEAHTAATPTGNVVEVKMVTDDKGNYFEPAELTVNRGDVVRFVLVSGVHNVSFPSDRNAAASAPLPSPSQYLQLPGQTFDLPVDLPPGEYGFVCDPHAALGMVGTLTVQ